MIIEKRTQFNISTEEYDDYGYVLCAVAAKRIDTDGVMCAYLSEHPEQCYEGEFKTDMFLEWLIEKGWATRRNVVEWHVSDYDIVILPLDSKYGKLQEERKNELRAKVDEEYLSNPTDFASTGGL